MLGAVKRSRTRPCKRPGGAWPGGEHRFPHKRRTGASKGRAGRVRRLSPFLRGSQRSSESRTVRRRAGVVCPGEGKGYVAGAGSRLALTCGGRCGRGDGQGGSDGKQYEDNETDRQAGPG